MLGKASEIKTMEMWHEYLDGWMEEHSELMIIDIKYALGKDDKASVLVIYKEV